MPFTLPQFPLSVNIWRGGTDVQANRPDIVCDGNLVFPRRSEFGPTIVSDFAAAWQMLALGWVYMSLLLPPLTDIRFRDSGIGQEADAVECPALSGRFYIVIFVDDVGKGFANEHRHALLLRYTPDMVSLDGNPSNIPGPIWPMS